MIRKEYTLEDTHDRYEVDVADGGLNDIDDESFLADTLSEAVTHLKQNGYRCNSASGCISKRGHDKFYYAMIWNNGFTVGDPEIVRKWAKV